MIAVHTLSRFVRRNLCVMALGATATCLVLGGLSSTLGTAQQAIAATASSREISDFEAEDLRNGYYKFTGLVTPSGPEQPSSVQLDGALIASGTIEIDGQFIIYVAYSPAPGDSVRVTAYDSRGGPATDSITF